MDYGSTKNKQKTNKKQTKTNKLKKPTNKNKQNNKNQKINKITKPKNKQIKTKLCKLQNIYKVKRFFRLINTSK